MRFLRRCLPALIACLLIRCEKQEQPTPGQIPARPTDASAPLTLNRETFAIDTLYLGDTFPPGVPSPEAWKHYGYDLDGVCTTLEQSTSSCALIPDASPSVLHDGDDCRDNTWGSTLLPMLSTPFWYIDTAIVPNISETATALVRGGAWTLELTTNGLEPGATDDIGLSLQARIGAPLVQQPTFDSSTDWPVLASEMLTLVQARLHFDDAYVSGGTFVSGDAAFVDGERTLILPIMLQGGQLSGGAWPLTLRIHNPVVTFTRSSSDPTHLANGVIAGTLDPLETVAAAHLLVQHLSGINPALSCGPSFEDVAGPIKHALDILPDGTNASSKPCSAISIGIGFEATQIANPTTSVPDPLPPVDTCVDAGAPDSIGD